MTLPVVPLVILILGAAAYCLPLPPKGCELGRLAFFAGLLVTLASEVAAPILRVH